MSKPESTDPNQPATTGHEWDGIKEFDNPLPRWWLFVFYGTIVVAAVYWVLMPAWPGLTGYTKGLLGRSDRAELAGELEALGQQRGEQAARLASVSLEDIERDPALQAYALSVGQSIFGDNCATCHGSGGAGSKGYPNLRDDVWLWGGSLEDIRHTIDAGVRTGAPDARNSIMPAFGRDQMLTDAQINDLVEHVVALSGRPAKADAAARGAELFASQCVACHGADGAGQLAMGAPNLTDKEWLYGGERADIKGQIWNGRGGVMPTWGGRFDQGTIKALAVYIHANAAGQ